jgi:hypothetical protein
LKIRGREQKALAPPPFKGEVGRGFNFALLW